MCVNVRHGIDLVHHLGLRIAKKNMHGRDTKILGQYTMMQFFLIYGQARVPKRDAFDGQRSHVHSCILRHHDLCCPMGFLFYALGHHGVIYNSNIETVVYLRCTYLWAPVVGVVASRAHWQCTRKSCVAQVNQATRRLS